MGLPPRSEDLATLLSRPSLLQRTGQAWKLSLGNGILVIGGALIVGGEFLLKGPASMTSILIGTLVGIAGFTWECLSVRCPQCRVKVVWYTYTHRSHRDAITWARHQPTCPKCGYDPS